MRPSTEHFNTDELLAARSHLPRIERMYNDSFINLTAIERLMRSESLETLPSIANPVDSSWFRMPFTPTRWKVLIFTGIVGSWIGIQWHRRPPLDPVLKASLSRPMLITQELVGDVKVLINGQDIVNGHVCVQSGAQVAISGECREQTVEHPMGMIVIGYRKSGAPDSSWENYDHDHEWMYPKSQNFQFFGDHRVNADPGDYELKVYVASISLRTNMPIMEHVLDGHMKVIPR